MFTCRVSFSKKNAFISHVKLSPLLVHTFVLCGFFQLLSIFWGSMLRWLRKWKLKPVCTADWRTQLSEGKRSENFDQSMGWRHRAYMSEERGNGGVMVNVLFGRFLEDSLIPISQRSGVRSSGVFVFGRGACELRTTGKSKWLRKLKEYACI